MEHGESSERHVKHNSLLTIGGPKYAAITALFAMQVWKQSVKHYFFTLY